MYLAKVVSAAGECSSSPFYVEVLPGPEWDWEGYSDSQKTLHIRSGLDYGLKSFHYGAKMKWVPTQDGGEEADAYCSKYGIQSEFRYKWFPPQKPTGWIEGTLGSWQTRTSLEEREETERDGKLAMHADDERKRLFNWLLEKSFAKSEADIEWRRAMSRDFGVTEDVREALLKIWTEQCWNLHIELDVNFDEMNELLCELDDWPDQSLLTTREEMLVGTSLNHTRDTHLQWEQEQAEAWSVGDYVSKLRWPGFRCKRLRANLQTYSSDTSSSSDSFSDSEEEEEREEQRRLKAREKINFDSECGMSVRIGEEEYREQSSDEESSENADEQDAIGRLQSLLLRNYEKEEEQVSQKSLCSQADKTFIIDYILVVSFPLSEL